MRLKARKEDCHNTEIELWSFWDKALDQYGPLQCTWRAEFLGKQIQSSQHAMLTASKELLPTEVCVKHFSLLSSHTLIKGLESSVLQNQVFEERQSLKNQANWENIAGAGDQYMENWDFCST